MIKEFNFTRFIERAYFLLSELPRSPTPHILLETIECLQRDERSLIKAELSRTLHDMALYSLSVHASREKNGNTLKERFFKHPFIKAFVGFVADPRFFGEVKAWVQATCADAPTPARKDLGGCVRILFDWTDQMGCGDYVIGRPNYSEFIVRYSGSCMPNN